MTSELRANTAPFTQFEQNIVINGCEVRKESHHVLFARTVKVFESPLPVLPWATWFCRELLVLPWAILVLPWTIWFCHELYGFAVRCLVLPSTLFGFAASFSLILPWGVWFCREQFNCGDSYIYKQLGHKQFS